MWGGMKAYTPQLLLVNIFRGTYLLPSATQQVNKFMQHPQPDLSDIRKKNLSNDQRVIYEQITQSAFICQKARGALYQIFCSLDETLGKTILIPAFHCPTVVQPAVLAGYKIQFYKINEDLSIDTDEVNNMINADTAAIVVIQYFGFSFKSDAFKETASINNCIIIEDWSHSFLQTSPLRLAGSNNSIATYSFWKIIPCVVGGGFINRTSKILNSTNYLKQSSTIENIKINKRIIESFINNSNSETLKNALAKFESFRKKRVTNSVNSSDNEKISPKEIIEADHYPIEPSFFAKDLPLLSNALLYRADFELIARKRRENFNTYLELTSGINLITPYFSMLPDDVCPWAFPIVLENRNQFDFKLRKEGVPFFTFGEQLHPLVSDIKLISPEARKISQYLSNSTLCLSAHQKLNRQEIEISLDKAKSILG